MEFVLPPASRERRVDPCARNAGHRSRRRASRDRRSRARRRGLGRFRCHVNGRNLAVFLQMLLNRGSYGGRRILSPASVSAMTRHQVDNKIPWVMPWVNAATGERVDTESRVEATATACSSSHRVIGFRVNGSLASASAFGHVGNGGSYIWADP